MVDNEDSQVEPENLQRELADGADAADETGGLLNDEQRGTLVRLIRVAYPHDAFPDGPYERTATAIQEADGADDLLEGGLAELDELAGGRFVDLEEDDATRVVEKIADTPFFALVHSTTVVALYDDHEVWELLGYEGSSFDKGGYLHRGFDDLDWLPDPRIEEYRDEERVELVEGGRS